MAITANSIVVLPLESEGNDWVVSLYSADVTGCEEIKAAETGRCHYIRRLLINTKTAMNFTLGSGENSSAVKTTYIGPVPVASGNFVYAIGFSGRGMKMASGEAFTIDSDTAGAITIYAEGRTSRA